MAPSFSKLTALAENVERAELDILRRALERLEEIKDQPGMQSECQALIRVVERSVGALFSRDDVESGSFGQKTHGVTGVPVQAPCSALKSVVL